MRKKFLGLVLVVAMSFTTLAPSTTYAATDKNSSSYTLEKEELGTTAFDDITYKRPDFDAMKAKIKKISSLTKKENQYKKIDKLMNELNDAMVDATTMNTYLNIQYSKDVTNMDLLTEMNIVTQGISTVSQLYCEACIALLESDYGAQVKKELTEDEIKSIYHTHDTLTDEYIELQAKASKLCSDHQITLSSKTVDVNGTPMTLTDLISDQTLSSQDFARYYSEIAQLINKDAGETYLELVDVYKSQAKLAGYDSVADYMYEQYDRDYTKEQASQFAEYVKEEIVPIYYSIYASLTQEDINNIQSISGSLAQFESRFKKYFKSINPSMLEAYSYLKKYNLCDFSASQVKQQLNYTTHLDSINEPYISLYPYGNYTDITNFIHEFGHFYAFYTHGNNLDTNLDILEIHSQANELLFMPNYSVYGDAYEPIVKNQIISLLAAVIQGCLHDEFQQKVYAGNYTTVEDLNKLYFQLECEYGLADPSMGTQDGSWVFITHTFQMPFYYISYAVSAIPALEIYTQSLTDRTVAIKTYNKVIKLGTNYDLTHLLLYAHLRSPFSDYTLDMISDSLYDEFKLQNPDHIVDPAA